MVSAAINHHLLFPLWSPFSVLLNNASFRTQPGGKGSRVPRCRSQEGPITNASFLYLGFKRLIWLWLGNTVLGEADLGSLFLWKTILLPNPHHFYKKKKIWECDPVCQTVLQMTFSLNIFLFLSSPNPPPWPSGNVHLGGRDRTGHVYSLSALGEKRSQTTALEFTCPEIPVEFLSF